MAVGDHSEVLIEKLDLPSPLRPYQWEGVRFLMRSDGALLADEMGLGKTVQAIVALRALMSFGGWFRVLIVTPRSLRRNWQEEMGRWAPELPVRLIEGTQSNRHALYLLPVPVVIATYEQVRMDYELFDPDEVFNVVLLDEAQRIKNTNSKTSLACRMIPRQKSWALTGTPLENRPEDMLSVFSFVQRGLLYNGMQVHEVHTAIKPFFLRRTKEEALSELPPIVIQDLKLELAGRQLEAYQELWHHREEAVRHVEGPVTQMHLLALITKLKQVCNFDSDSNESVKLESLKLVIENLSAKTDKLIVFSQYVEALKWLSEQLDRFPHDLFHGGLNDDEREAVLQRFRQQPGPRAILMSLKAGGVGLNLQEASTVVIFDRWWNPATEDQAIQRAHRFGRTRPLHVIRFIVQNSIEQRIDDLLREKRSIFDQYVTNAESADVPHLTTSDLWRILNTTRSETEQERPD